MFYFDKINGKKILKSNLIDNAFFTTKESFIKTKDDEMFEITKKNKQDIIRFLNVEKLVSPSQRHTGNIEFATIDKDFYENTDGLILKDKKLAIFLNFADCAPLVFYDNILNVGAIAHAGWRGTVETIGKKTIQKMLKEGSRPENIKTLIGPCISKCCFETDEDVAIKLYKTIEMLPPKTSNGKIFADLKEINKIQIMQTGIKNLDVCPFCTVCNNDLFFSYRNENATTNRHSAVLYLK